MTPEIDFNRFAFGDLPEDAKNHPLPCKQGPWHGKTEHITAERWKRGLGLEWTEQSGGISTDPEHPYSPTREVVTGHYRLIISQGQSILVWQPLGAE